MRSAVRLRGLIAAFAIAVSCADEGQPPPYCGDGNIDPGEGCDPGRGSDQEGCSRCQASPGFDCRDGECSPICGDGQVKGSEACDWLDEPAYCSSDCSQMLGACNDGIVQSSAEDCDQGNGLFPGCEGCRADFGYTCDPAANTCVATGLPPDTLLDDLTHDELVVLCGWLASEVFGGESTIECDGFDIYANSVAECVDEIEMNGLPDSGQCTVGQFEQFVAAQDSACELWTAAGPVC
jgi:hypothetical protein